MGGTLVFTSIGGAAAVTAGAVLAGSIGATTTAELSVRVHPAPARMPSNAARARTERRSIRRTVAWPSMPLEGRGAYYTRKRAAMEWTLLRAYRGGWPAQFVRRLGLQRSVRTVEHRIACPRWPKGLRPLRCTFASDLHAGPTTHPTLLDDAFDTMERAKPDVMFLGGDYIFLDGRHIHQLAPRIRRTSASLAKVAVLGNHDLWADDELVKRTIEDAGARVLVNECLRLPPPYEMVTVHGLDDPWTGKQEPKVMEEGGDVRIVVSHAPEGLFVAGDARFDVMLAGHTHGGHIALPGGVPVVSVGPLGRRFPHGRHDVGQGRTLIVSRGIGGTESAFRWNADPDVIVVELGPQ